MNPKRILLILAGLLAFTAGLVSALHAQNLPSQFEVCCSKVPVHIPATMQR
jgi:hypothetical protein